jgi:uncharacterized protein (DUF608 family)
MSTVKTNMKLQKCFSIIVLLTTTVSAVSEAVADHNTIEGVIGVPTETKLLLDKAPPILNAWETFRADGLTNPATGIVYTDQHATCCGMPLGGLSTGCIDLGVRGVLGMSTVFSDYTLYGANPKSGLWRGVVRTPPSFAPFLGLSVGAKTWVLADSTMVKGGVIQACVEPALNYDADRKGASGADHWKVDVTPIKGVGHAQKIRYWGHYPVADVEYDTDAPVNVSMRAWSPFIPGDAVASNIPAAAFEVTVKNSSAVPRNGSLAFTFPGPADHEDRNATRFIHDEFQEPGLTGVRVLANSDFPVEYAVATNALPEKVRIGGGLGRDGTAWQNIHKSLPALPDETDQGYQRNIAGNLPLYTSSTERGATLVIAFELEPGESKTIPLYLGWYAPNWVGSDGLPYAHFYRRRYGKHERGPFWAGVMGVVRELARRREELRGRILAWQDEVYGDPELPGWLQDSLINSLAVLAETSFWVPAESNGFLMKLYGEGGSFFGLLESPRGCPQVECIPCSWYGNQPIVYFFPELAQSTLQAYAYHQAPDGEIPFTMGGWQVGRPYMSRPGYFWQKSLNSTCYVDLVHRNWKRTGDREALAELYPSVKKAMVYTMNMRPTPDGVISMPSGNEGMQWFEMGKWAGMVSHIGGLRLAQCRMGEDMAQVMGDEEFAEQCRSWFKQGSHAMEQKMWADGYYLNFFEEETNSKSDDVMAYQLDGQWAARFHGLKSVFHKDRIRQVLETVRKTNVPHAICGAINFAHPDGTLLSSDDKVAAYGTRDMFCPEVLILSMNYIYDGERAFGIELARRSLENIAARHGYTWDLPNRVNGATGERVFGTDYYQNLMIWSMPAALAGEDLSGPAKGDGLVARMIKAANP